MTCAIMSSNASSEGACCNRSVTIWSALFFFASVPSYSQVESLAGFRRASLYETSERERFGRGSGSRVLCSLQSEHPFSRPSAAAHCRVLQRSGVAGMGILQLLCAACVASLATVASFLLALAAASVAFLLRLEFFCRPPPCLHGPYVARCSWSTRTRTCFLAMSSTCCRSPA